MDNICVCLNLETGSLFADPDAKARKNCWIWPVQFLPEGVLEQISPLCETMLANLRHGAILRGGFIPPLESAMEKIFHFKGMEACAKITEILAQAQARELFEKNGRANFAELVKNDVRKADAMDEGAGRLAMKAGFLRGRAIMALRVQRWRLLIELEKTEAESSRLRFEIERKSRCSVIISARCGDGADFPFSWLREFDKSRQAFDKGEALQGVVGLDCARIDEGLIAFRSMLARERSRRAPLEFGAIRYPASQCGVDIESGLRMLMSVYGMDDRACLWNATQGNNGAMKVHYCLWRLPRASDNFGSARFAYSDGRPNYKACRTFTANWIASRMKGNA